MLAYCHKCGTPLKGGASYCLKCGYNNATGAEEKLRVNERKPKISVKAILVTTIMLLISFMAVYFVYQFASANTENIQKVISTFSKDMLKNIAIVLGISILIESILAYKTMDDGIFKSLFQFMTIYLISFFLFWGYSFIIDKPTDLKNLPIFAILFTILIVGAFYFLAKWLSSNASYRMRIGKYFLFLIIYSFFRILSWVLTLFLFYVLISTHILIL